MLPLSKHLRPPDAAPNTRIPAEPDLAGGTHRPCSALSRGEYRSLKGEGKGRAMEPHDLRLHLAIALKEPEIRRACCAVEAIFRAGTILDELSPAVLEQVRDYCTDWNKGRKGSFSEFKHAWIDLVADHLNEQRMTERRLYHGITGRPSADATATLAKHELPSTAAALATHATDTKG